ncbi:MAG: radical SAM protein [Spirochaetaceae bacterium]|jgi:radical SAM superfamily enzyme YgiQ (UPF0313 family)|nr:radical SAM protein [Spirochaetaceae bacterium]
MKILFIVPSSISFEDMLFKSEGGKQHDKTELLNKIKQQLRSSTYGPHFPMGPLSIAAYIKKFYKDIEIVILDFTLIACKAADDAEFNILDAGREDFWTYCLNLMNGFTPDIIGIAGMFSSLYYELPVLSSFLKSKYINTIIICGGHFPSACYKEILETSTTINAVCFGEGEIPFKQLVEAYQQKAVFKYFEENNSWITHKKMGGGGGINLTNQLIIDLDEIPPFELNIIAGYELYAHYRNRLFRETMTGTKLEYFTTRGCPGHCVFCASHNVHGHKVRYHSVERVKSDIKKYITEYNIDEIIFQDDHFLAKKQRALDILNFIVENNYKADIAVLAFFSIDEDIADVLKNLKLEAIGITIESGNPTTLKNIIHKPGDLNTAKKAVEILRKRGFMIFTNILTGLPGETKESIQIGFDNLIDIGCNWATFYTAAPLPGSELYDICKKNDYLIKEADVFKMNFTRCLIQTPDFSPEYITKKNYEMNLSLNFVQNYDMRHENYKTALILFERVFTYIAPDHAFAYYFAAKCAAELGLAVKYHDYRLKYEAIKTESDFWQEWIAYFKLEPLNRE